MSELNCTPQEAYNAMSKFLSHKDTVMEALVEDTQNYIDNHEMTEKEEALVSAFADEVIRKLLANVYEPLTTQAQFSDITHFLKKEGGFGENQAN